MSADHTNEFGPVANGRNTTKEKAVGGLWKPQREERVSRPNKASPHGTEAVSINPRPARKDSKEGVTYCGYQY